jgi:DNA-binding FadR family transcriptional regulator
VPRRPRFIAHLIQRGIAAGEFGPGTILPSEAELAERYTASAEGCGSLWHAWTPTV